MKSEVINQIYTESLNLKIKMHESDNMSESVKERDYGLYQIQLNGILEKIGNHFLQKENIQKRINFNFDSNKYFKQSNENMAQIVLEKNKSYIPKATVQNVDSIIDLLGSKGLNTQNNNLLVVMRAFHYQKYK